MPLYKNAEKLILFIHVPKTGGSTVEEVLCKSGAKQALKHHKRLDYSKSTPQHMPWHVIHHWLPADFYDYAFAVVRNPWLRLVSEYRWRGVLSKSPLPDFDIWVNKELDRYVEAPYINDGHMHPQTAFVGPRVEIFRLEDGLEKPIHTGLRKLGLPTEDITIHHARKSEHHPLALKETTFEKVCGFYAPDFQEFSYDPKTLPRGLTVVRSRRSWRLI